MKGNKNNKKKQGGGKIGRQLSGLQGYIEYDRKR